MATADDRRRSAIAAMSKPSGDRTADLVVWIALASNVGIALAKIAVATATGSSAMLSEAFHSIIDTSNGLIILYGRWRSKKPPDDLHPTGYGREIWFWSFVVAVLILGLGAGLSIYEGVHHILEPEPIRNPGYIFGVIAIAFVLEGISFVVSFRTFDRLRGTASMWRAIRISKDPSQFSVLLEDGAALAGLLIAAAGTGLALLTGETAFDGAASIMIGLVLAAVAFVLARESKDLLIGERGNPQLTADLRAALEIVPEVADVQSLLTLQTAPGNVVAFVSATFHQGVSAAAVASILTSVEDGVRQRYPALGAVYIKPAGS